MFTPIMLIAQYYGQQEFEHRGKKISMTRVLGVDVISTRRCNSAFVALHVELLLLEMIAFAYFYLAKDFGFQLTIF